jgi:hypothetical protein
LRTPLYRALMPGPPSTFCIEIGGSAGNVATGKIELLPLLAQRSGAFFTFARIPMPRVVPPPVRQLKCADNPHADYVAQYKMKQPDFKSLSWVR